MKERITLTLDSDLLKKIDLSVDGFRIKNRSHAIELLLLKSMQTNIPHHAIILAAGQNPKTSSKDLKEHIGMEKVHNKPIIEHLIALFKKYNVKDILIGVCYNKESIKTYFGNGNKFGVRIRYLEEEVPSGTATLVKKAKPFLSGNFFVTNADELKEINLADMYLTHKENNALATIALTTVEDPKPYGVVSVDGIRVREFIEKPGSEFKYTNLINAGLYLLELEVLDVIPDDVNMLYDFFPILAEHNNLIGYPFSGQWYDISSADGLAKARKEWKE